MLTRNQVRKIAADSLGAEARAEAPLFFALPGEIAVIKQTTDSGVDFHPELVRMLHKSPTSYLIYRRVYDRLFAAALLVILAPLLIAIYCAIVFTSKGPGFYLQRELGYRGKPFSILKFRTTHTDMPRTTSNRVTRVGRLLKASRLDSLPLLLNVVRGDLALIGHRPKRTRAFHLLDRYARFLGVEWHVMPGMLQPSHFTVPNVTVETTIEQEISLDLLYIFQANAWLDMRILAASVFEISGIQNLGIPRLLGLVKDPREVTFLTKFLKFGLSGPHHRFRGFLHFEHLDFILNEIEDTETNSTFR